jgi:hypothetical protein
MLTVTQLSFFGMIRLIHWSETAMSNPWDVPPFPTQGDSDITALYAAKGKAVSEWEKIEVALCYLYAILCGEKWDDVEAYRRYGDPRNFGARADALEREAGSYFTGKCSQKHEGILSSLLTEVRGFQFRRNEITHSVVTYRPLGESKSEHFLLPPEYAKAKFDKGDKAKFIYTSREIEALSFAFSRLSHELSLFAGELALGP